MSVFAANKVALITGGASGIGLAIAKLCRSHNMRTAIVDVNAAALGRAKEALAGGADVETFEADVSVSTQWSALRRDVEGKFGGVDLLVLNAAVAGGPWSWDNPAYFERVVATNFFGVVYGLCAFVPYFKEQNKVSSVVITGSKQGITNPPGNPAYGASKAAVKSIAEQLSFDLRDTNTSVHLLVPGWTYTGMTGASAPEKQKPAGASLPEQVADYLYAKMKDNKFYAVCPDGEVTEEMDRKRIAWTAGDITEERLPLSRWRPEYKEEVAKKLG